MVRQVCPDAGWNGALWGKAPSEVVIGRVWPFLADGEYWGVIERDETAPSAFHPRKPRRDGQQLQEWKLYLHVRLVKGADARTDTALTMWRSQHDGQDPVVFWAARFMTRPGGDTPEAPPASSKLHKALILLRRKDAVTGARVRFSAFQGRHVRVFVGTVVKDADGDPLAGGNYYSVVRKIQEILPRNAGPTSHPQPQPATKYQVPTTNNQHLHPGEEERQVFTPVGAVLAAGANGVGPLGARGTIDRPGGGGVRPSSLGSTPSPSVVSPEARRARIWKIFGKGADIAPHGPCPRCGETMFARSGEKGRCPWCQG
jgi:hypothetical protein